MIPFVDFSALLMLFSQIVYYIRFRKLSSLDLNDEMEILVVSLNTMTVMLDYCI